MFDHLITFKLLTETLELHNGFDNFGLHLIDKNILRLKIIICSSL